MKTILLLLVFAQSDSISISHWKSLRHKEWYGDGKHWRWVLNATPSPSPTPGTHKVWNAAQGWHEVPNKVEPTPTPDTSRERWYGPNFNLPKQ